MSQGITEMSFESSILCFAKGRKIGTLQKDKHHQAQLILIWSWSTRSMAVAREVTRHG
jgi:hypothetical protein